MANLSGKNGKVTLGASDFADVRNWSLTLSSNNSQYGSSSTAGHKKSVAGTKNCSLSFNVVLDTADEAYSRVKPGDSATLVLYENATRNFSVPCRIDEVGEEVDIDDGGEITVSVSASGNGAWTYPGGTVST